ncbi:MAG: ADP-ribosylglycohydrolase family protein [Nakamurella sp.]
MNLLQDKAIGALAAAAVGDAIGGATEGRSAEEIVARYGGFVEGITEYFMPDWRTAKPMSPYFKGDGHVTDDTLMTNLLVDVYDERQRHLDAFDIADGLVPRMMNQLTWIPELERETVPLLRVFLAEKWLVTRLHYGHVDPREGGVGNVVNCGAAMYMAPVGIANAGDPAGAYAEASELAGAHQSSYGREAAAVFAAAIAAAMTPGIDVDGVLHAVLGLARDGTAAAIRAVLEAAQGVADWQQAIPVLRAAITPFDTVGPEYRTPVMDARRPSRVRAIEELPVALGFLAVTGGDVRGCILGATNYGRDSDSIATMGGAIAGALGGESSVPAEWVETVSRESRLDLRAGGLRMAAVAQAIRSADVAAFARREHAFAALTADGQGNGEAALS